MYELGFYVPFNSISVISGRWKGEDERLGAMKYCFINSVILIYIFIHNFILYFFLFIYLFILFFFFYLFIYFFFNFFFFFFFFCYHNQSEFIS